MQTGFVNKIVTLGPATRERSALAKMRARGVDFVRTNMSHSSIEELVYFMDLAAEVGLPFMLDTEGSQIRTSDLPRTSLSYAEGHAVQLRSGPGEGDEDALYLTPGFVVAQLELGDVIHVDFDSVILLVTNTSSAGAGYVTAEVLNAGAVGKNKAVYVDRASTREIRLPALSPKDHEAIAIALDRNIDHIAASFVRSAEAVDQVREATRGRMKIVSKIECIEALQDLDRIIDRSDYLLIDRGDLSKEIPIEKIPFAQKYIIHLARQAGKGAIVATNLLETMIDHRRPTRAEVNDVINTIEDGAIGLTLAAETAIGSHPIECVNVLNRLIKQADMLMPAHDRRTAGTPPFVKAIADANYLLDSAQSSMLAPPHGGRLVNRIRTALSEQDARDLPKVPIGPHGCLDLWQIAHGAYSPLEGFMVEDDLLGVLENYRLASGMAWPLPILLDVTDDVADRFGLGDTVALEDNAGHIVGTMQVEDRYRLDLSRVAKLMFGTDDRAHPGVSRMHSMHPTLIGGRIDYNPRPSLAGHDAYNLTPRQVRRLFEERNWSRVVGFHTRNVPHRAHEFIQRAALERESCDGLFIHPVVGPKKPGDFEARFIIETYQRLIRDIYPQGDAVFGTFCTFSRYAGPREALFTALCRQNFGCTHFVIGRDHTGTANYYDADSAQKLFERFDDLVIQPSFFGNVVFSDDQHGYVEENELAHSGRTGKSISGSAVREMLLQGTSPPEWFMRREVSSIILDALERGERVFVE